MRNARARPQQCWEEFHWRKMSDWSIPDHVTQSKFNVAAKSSLVCLFQEKEEKLEPS